MLKLDYLFYRPSCIIRCDLTDRKLCNNKCTRCIHKSNIAMQNYKQLNYLSHLMRVRSCSYEPGLVGSSLSGTNYFCVYYIYLIFLLVYRGEFARILYGKYICYKTGLTVFMWQRKIVNYEYLW